MSEAFKTVFNPWAAEICRLRDAAPDMLVALRLARLYVLRGRMAYGAENVLAVIDAAIEKAEPKPATPDILDLFAALIDTAKKLSSDADQLNLNPSLVRQHFVAKAKELLSKAEGAT